MPSALRIFVSSPGDVIPERRRANLVIEKFAKTYARFFSIEAILWEVEPMLASGHFQDQITPPSETDILVLIVWSRLGTALPEQTGTREYRGIDGRVPVTGTEWEFEDALAAQKLHGAPDLLAYRKQAAPLVAIGDKSILAAAEEQWDRLNLFWNRWFVNRGEFRAAFTEFVDLDSFESRLENDLRILIERRVQSLRSSGQEPAAAIWLADSPFRGLETYRFEHAPIFFGRSSVTKTAVEQLTGNAENCRAFLLILGASGAGKSSLAQAGVLAALTGRGIVPGVGEWRHGVMHPGGHQEGPFGALADALISKSALPELLAPNQDKTSLAKHLRTAADDPNFPLIAALNQIESAGRARGDLLQIESTRLALIVDQLEELFTANEVGAAEREAFIRCLDGLARCGRVFLIATMRNDYWHRASETPRLIEMAAGSGRFDLLPPAKDEIYEMIRQPAEAAGIDFENDPTRDVRLDATLGAEAEANPGALPLLSFLLDELYKADVKEGGHSTLTFASMRKLGGLTGAIANRAEAAFVAQPADVQAALPKILRTLVTVSRVGADATARVAPMSRFPGGSPERRLVEAFLDPHVRLMVAEGDGEGARVRLAHEALITHWERARRQIAQDRDDLRIRTSVEEAVVEWRGAAAHNKQVFLLRDPQLANAVDLAKRWHDEFDDETIGFIESSRRRARLLHRLTMGAAAVFAIVAVIAGIATYFADRERQSAESETKRATAQEERALLNQSRFLANSADNLRGLGYPAQATALALEALPDSSRGNTRPYLMEAERSLFSSVQTLRERATLLGHADTVTNVTFSPDGRTILSSSWDHHAKLWDVATWSQTHDLYDNNGAITTARFSPDGRSILVAPSDGTARIFDAATGAVIHRLVGTGNEFSDGRYSADGARIFTAAEDKSPRLWDASTGELVAELNGHADKVLFGAFSPDSRIVVTVGTEQVIKAWQASDGHFLFETPAIPAQVNSVEFSPDGRYLAGTGADGSVWLWDAGTGKLVRTMTAGINGWAGNFAFSPDSERLAVAYGDHIVRVWQVASGLQVFQLKGHTDNILFVVYSPNGQFIATTSVDKTARLWDAASGSDAAVFRGHGSPVRRAAFSPDGRWLATESGMGTDVSAPIHDNSVRIWNMYAALEIGAVREPRHILEQAAISANSGLIAIRDSGASNSDAGKLSAPAQLWNADTHEDLGDLRVGNDSVVSAVAAPDGARIATIGRDGDLRLWDATTAASVAVYHSNDFRAAMSVFSRDGSMLAVALTSREGGTGEYPVVVLHSGDGGRLAMLPGPSSSVDSLSFALDGKHLLGTVSSFGSDRGFRVWPITDGAQPTIVADEDISSATFIGDGAKVLTAEENGKIRSWQSETGAQLAEWDSPGDFGSVSHIGPDGRVFVAPLTALDQGASLRIVHTDTGHELSVPIPDHESAERVTFAPNGSYFATDSESDRILIWKAIDGELAGNITTAIAVPRLLQFSNEGKLLAIGAADGAIELHEIGSGGEAKLLKGHAGAITSIAFSADDRQVVSGSSDTTARIWDIASGKESAILQSHGTAVASVAFVPSSRRILTLGSETPATTPQQVLIANGESGKVAAKVIIPGPSTDSDLALSTLTALSTQASLAFSQSGDRLVVNNSLVFDAHDGKLLFSPPVSDSTFVEDAATSPSGKLVAWKTTTAGTDDDAPVQVQIADVASGKVIKTLSIAAAPQTDSSLTDTPVLSFSPDDHYLMAGNRIFSIETGDEWREPTSGENAQLSYSADGGLLAVVSKAAAAVDPFDDAVALSDPRSGRVLFTLRGNTGPVSALAVDPSGKSIATVADGEPLKLWDTGSGRQTGLIDLTAPDSQFLSSVSRLAFSPDGTRLAIADSSKIQIWDVASRKQVGSVAMSCGVDRLAYSTDGHLLALSCKSGDQGLRLWNASDLTPVPLSPWKPAFPYGSPFAFSPDGRHIVSTPGGTQALVIDTGSGAVAATLRGHDYDVMAIAYSPDGRWIATGARGDKLLLWDSDSFVETIIATDHEDGINSVAFSSDGRIIAVAGNDKTISLWDAEKHSLLRKLAGHADEVTHVSFIDGGKRLVSVGADRTIRTWNIDTGEQISEIVHRGDINDFAITDKFIASANAKPRDEEQRFELSLWDTTGRRKIELQHQQNGTFSVLLSHDGRYLLTLPGMGSKDDAPTLYDVNEHKLVAKLKLDGELIGNSAVFSPSGDNILTYSFYDVAYLWRSSDGAFLGTVQGQARNGIIDLLNSGPAVYKAEFVAEGRRFLTYSSNGVVRLWDFATRRLLAAFYESDVNDYNVALDGRRLITTHEDGSIRISELPTTTQEFVDLGCRLLPAPLTSAERRAYALDPNPDHYPCDRKPSQ